MGDKEILGKAFRDLPNRVQNASIAERVEIFQNVTDVLSNPGITEQIIRGLCKVIQLTLPKYRDAQSQHLVKNLIVSLCKEHPLWATKHMNVILKDIVSQNINEPPSKSTAQTGLYALGWSCLVFINTFSKFNAIEENNKKEDEMKDLITLIEVQSKLLQIVLSAGLTKLNDIIHTMFSQMFSSVENSLEVCAKYICKVDQGVNTIVYLSNLLLRVKQNSKDFIGWKNEYIEPHKNVLLDIFIKNMITVKIKPNAHLISACGSLLQIFSETDFTSHILPALQKSMLRNPEIIIECVGHIIDNVEIDTSACLQDLGKHLIANLRSKEAITRDESNATLKSLCIKCLKQETIDSLVKLTCSVYNGSEGKLALTEHKTSVLQAIGNFSLNMVPNQDLSKTTHYVIDFFIKVLTTEQNEKLLCFMLEMFSLWALRIENEVPKVLVECFKKGLSLKSSNVQVRTCYCQMLLSSLENAKLPQEADLENALIKVVEKSLVQNNQTSVLSESLSASCLILKSLSGKYEQGKLNPLWNAVLDMQKQIYFTDKFLQSAADDALYQIVILCKELLKFYRDRINGDINILYNAVMFACINSGSTKRSKCLKLVENILEGDGVVRLCLLKQFSKYLENLKNDVESKNLIEFLKIIFYNAENLQICDAQKLCVESLICAHHPSVVCLENNMWCELILTYYKQVLPENLIAQYSKDIKKMLIEDYKAVPSYENALSTCIKLNPWVILPSLVKKLCEKLQDPSILYITRDEYFTYLTPEGEVYDKSGLPGNDDDELNEFKNMKRESKVYSYKEQQEELQLRRELLQKKKLEGKIPELTPKQKEALRSQLDKEQIIRKRLQVIYSDIILIESQIKACIRGNPKEFSLFYSSLVTDLLNNLQSPLAAGSFVKLYQDMGKGVFEDDHEKGNKNVINLGESIARATIRLWEPNCDLESVFETDKDISSQIRDVMTTLYEITIKSKHDSSFEMELENEHSFLLNAPQFSYSFPFISKTMLSEASKKDETLAHDVLQVISHHARMYGSDFHNPKYLPRKLMLELLVEVIGTSSGRIQTQAVSTLLNVANACLHAYQPQQLNSNNTNSSMNTDQSEEIGVLLTALEQPVDAVRDAALRSIEILLCKLPKLEDNYDAAMRVTKRLWIAKFDSHEENSQLASQIWTQSGYDTPLALCDAVLEDVTHSNLCVQQASAKALAELLRLAGGQQSDVVTEVMEKLLKVYEEKLKMVPAKKDQFDRIIEQPIDTWQPRRGVALACTQLAPLLDSESVTKIMDFYVSAGLGDRKNTVQKEMLNAALAAVDNHGKQAVSSLLPVFEKFLDGAPKSGSYDAKRQAVVILMGSLARHLDKDDPRIKPIVMRLIAALNTPSQQVQESVANCLPHLVGSVKEDAGNIIQKLLHQLQKAEKYGDRKGAAYGLAGMVKGLGILSLKQYDIMNTLTVAIQEKKNYKYREGALFAFEMLCATLGRLFEPYIVHVLPHLLSCFGDSSQYVRAATDDTAKQVMSKLSAHGVKLVLPALLAALEEDSWRTKTGSVELLGAMAYCAPKQLSSCLPSIVPKLIEVLSDSHMKVQEAGAEALKVIGSVIRNPEIQAIVPVLLQALQDPSNKTSVCLQTLLDTQFVHFIDAPSLALVMPVVQRAFLDRSTETRKMAAQIIGNMYSLTDQKDLTPYLPNIIPGLKTSLLDPVPEVRSVSSRALGAMVRGMGEASFEDLLPWLMQTLTSETSSVDRSGAAQGLSEVVGGLGVEKLHRLMPEIIATAERTDIAPHVKDGYIMMFIYMPNAFPMEFTPYIGQIINPILKALADENEYVRDTALKAGQRIVNLYADSAIMLLLPELERGLFDDNWRIRYSSVQLLGDLLYRVSGVSGKMSTETASEDDNFGTEQSHAAIITALGAERRNRVLAGLYMGRSDVALMVRQAALHVWKVVVTNTPRTLREILPTLFGLLLGCLASTSHDKRQVAARTLGDLVRKLGERVLPEIIPILEKGLNSDQPDQRQGVCIGLSEIMSSTSRDTVLTFAHSLVPTVRRALCDPLPEVRRAAAKTFDGLHATVGPRALDDVLPSMLEDLNNPDSELAASSLDGLRQVMAVKSRAVLPYLVPQLTARPANTKALGALAAAAAGDALARHLHKILPALIEALCDARNEGREAQELEYCQAVVLSVNDETGIRTIMDSLMDSTKSDQTEVRRAAVTLLCAFCSQSRADYSQYVPQLLRGLIRLFTDTDKDVLIRSWEALNAVTKTLDSEQQIAHVSDVRQAVRFASSDLQPGELLPGFCLPKGVAPILPIFREAVLNGMPDAKESATQGLGEIIKLTSASALQPSVVHITGPLIRILGDRFNADVKAAVLETLAILLAKVGVMLKQFLPQLQTTFLKSLSDSNKVVRVKAGQALGQLIVIHTRADPIFVEIHNGIKNSQEDPAVRETMLQALRGVTYPCGDKMSDPVRKQITQTLIGLLEQNYTPSEEGVRIRAAGCLGSICGFLDAQKIDEVLTEHILVDDIASRPENELSARVSALAVAIKERPKSVLCEAYEVRTTRFLANALASDKPLVACSAIRACAYLFHHLMIQEKDSKLPQQLLTPFVRTMNHASNDVKQLLGRASVYLAKYVLVEYTSQDLIRALVPALVNGTKEKNGYVKANSELGLVAILRLRQGDDVHKRYSVLLDIGARESLNDVVSKVLRKTMLQPEGKEDELDDTLIS